jgi:uncharacterized membrane protein
VLAAASPYDAPVGAGDHEEGSEMLGAYGSDAYNVVKVLHILCAIVGFGGVMLNGLYGAQAKKRGGREAVAIGESVYRVSLVAEYFIYAVFVLGIALVAMGNNLFDFGQTWIWVSTLLYVIGLGVSHGVLRPRVKRLNALMVEVAAGAGPPNEAEAARLEGLGKQLATTEAALNLLLVAILVLMVFKPGGPKL